MIILRHSRQSLSFNRRMEGFFGFFALRAILGFLEALSGVFRLIDVRFITLLALPPPVYIMGHVPIVLGGVEVVPLYLLKCPLFSGKYTVHDHVWALQELGGLVHPVSVFLTVLASDGEGWKVV